jgi:hypothetical protein
MRYGRVAFITTRRCALPPTDSSSLDALRKSAEKYDAVCPGKYLSRIVL